MSKSPIPNLNFWKPGTMIQSNELRCEQEEKRNSVSNFRKACVAVTLLFAALFSLFLRADGSVTGRTPVRGCYRIRLEERWFPATALADHRICRQPCDPGTTIHVLPGTYASSRIIVTRASGTSRQRIRYVSELRWGAKLVTSATQVWQNTGAYVDIEGFDITSSSNVTYIGIHSQGSYDRLLYNHIHGLAAPLGSCPQGGGIMMGDMTTMDRRRTPMSFTMLVLRQGPAVRFTGSTYPRLTARSPTTFCFAIPVWGSNSGAVRTTAWWPTTLFSRTDAAWW